MKNKYRHNPDGSTTIFIESRKHGTKECLIDTEDFEHVGAFTGAWTLTSVGHYAATSIIHPSGRWDPRADGYRQRQRKMIRMHHVVIGKPEHPLVTDHVDGNRLNNRKSNLRHATLHENAQNKIIGAHNRLGYKGIRTFNCSPNYGATFHHATAGNLHLGTFPTKEEAAQAYDLAVVEHREIINAERQLNFPEKLKEYEALLATNNKR